ncbi:unnamed protein product, partial [Sphagnum compactum]
MAESAQEGRIIFACQFYGSPSTPLKLPSGLICPSAVGNGQGLAEFTPDPRPTQNLACLGSCPFYKLLLDKIASKVNTRPTMSKSNA